MSIDTSYPEPFRAPLEKGLFAYNGDLRKFSDTNQYVVRVEEYSDENDLVGYDTALKDFEEISGLNVVPHWNVIAESDPPEYLVGVNYSDNARFPALFHIAKFVTSEVMGRKVDELDFPPEIAASLLEGLTEYSVTVYQHNMPYAYEIRPAQFMYGKVHGDQSPKLYMVDVDYALSHREASIDDVMYNLCFNVDYLKEYAPHPLLRPAALRILDFINSADALEWSRQTDATKDTWESLEIDLLDYLDAIDHL